MSAKTTQATVERAVRNMYSAMLESDSDALALLLDEHYSLTHMTGYRQPKHDWLTAIAAGEMRYHSAQEVSISVDVSSNTATAVARHVVEATIYGSRGTWNLQLTTSYELRHSDWIALHTVATTFR
jgi:inosine-uridine nucleoside N-ribohydrolase